MPTIGMAGARHGCRRGHQAPSPPWCVWAGSPCEQPLHRAGLTNSSVLLMTCRDCGDMGRVRQMDGQQLLRMAVLAPALEMVLAAPCFHSHVPQALHSWPSLLEQQCPDCLWKHLVLWLIGDLKMILLREKCIFLAIHISGWTLVYFNPAPIHAQNPLTQVYQCI